MLTLELVQSFIANNRLLDGEIIRDDAAAGDHLDYVSGDKTISVFVNVTSENFDHAVWCAKTADGDFIDAVFWGDETGEIAESQPEPSLGEIANAVQSFMQ